MKIIVHTIFFIYFIDVRIKLFCEKFYNIKKLEIITEKLKNYCDLKIIIHINFFYIFEDSRFFCFIDSIIHPDETNNKIVLFAWLYCRFSQKDLFYPNHEFFMTRKISFMFFFLTPSSEGLVLKPIRFADISRTKYQGKYQG